MSKLFFYSLKHDLCFLDILLNKSYVVSKTEIWNHFDWCYILVFFLSLFLSFFLSFFLSISKPISLSWLSIASLKYHSLKLLWIGMELEYLLVILRFELGKFQWFRRLGKLKFLPTQKRNCAFELVLKYFIALINISGIPWILRILNWISLSMMSKAFLKSTNLQNVQWFL